MRSAGHHIRLRESLFDFKLGYGFTLVLALMFLTIGAFSVYGSGVTLEGNATAFSNQLLGIFTTNIGEWSYYIFAVSAFGTIYGTLITIMDAFPRCFVRGLRVLKYAEIEHSPEQQNFLERYYKLSLILVGTGGFALFYFSAASMIRLLDVVTIISFLTSPVIAFLNLRAIQSKAVPESFRPAAGMIWLAYAGLLALVIFSIYYLINTFG
jgi:Mn2+/Fe2+ NRAMP family transporter